MPELTPSTSSSKKQAIGRSLKPLIDDLLKFWNDQSLDWDEMVLAAGDESSIGDDSVDLWDDMPEVDSKAVARSSPIFEQHLGIALDVRLIRAGGYVDFQDMVDDLVPKMAELAKVKIQ